MPNFDQTGPQGQGPMTGRGMGNCAGGMRRGRGCRNGMGYNGRFSQRTYLTKGEEVKALEEEAENLKADLKAIEEQINELKK